MLRGQKATLESVLPELRELNHPVWVHAASLGEFEQGRTLIERLRREQPGRQILLSFFSPSGYEVRKNYAHADKVIYLPFDTPDNARALVKAVDPSMAIFVKYEFWGNYIEQLHERDIPVYLISAIFRKGQIFFRPWGGFMRHILTLYRHIYVQDENSAKLLASVGVTNVTVAGDTRFDRVTEIMKTTAEIKGIDQFNQGMGADLIVGSSWEADEEKYIPWLNAHPEVTFIIAPHEFNDKRLAALRKSIDGKVMYLSEWEQIHPDGEKPSEAEDVRGLIVDCFGKLSTLYRYARMAYIGGGFGAGIHNINEAAVYGMPVIFGPTHKKFKEAADLIALGGGFSCHSAADVTATLDNLYTNRALLASSGKIAGDYIKRNIGATDVIYHDLFK
ncbi:MAG: 3-deoxy-D-manno-octulosonic acid transferase [Muribaculaceae bacterium]|nr:3-deoxy-D-manno-octulosonic acid transferase [Muribaculaceae bacterium]